ncbi:hypothetical protein ACWCQQ_48440 [Streptomyces sp. NPDC002143]
MTSPEDDQKEPEARSRSFPWSEWVYHGVVPVLALAGAIVFGLLTVEYDQFYRELGVAPGDVGVEYSTRLSGSVGLLAMILLVTVVLAALTLSGAAVFCCLGLRRSGAREGEPSSGDPYRFKQLPHVIVGSAAVAVLLVGVFVVHRADAAADHAKQGKWVDGVALGPVTVLAVRAAPADVHITITEAGKQLNLPKVDTTGLLYLGHGRTTVVLYDTNHHRPLYLPAAHVTVVTYNCETYRLPGRHLHCPD